MGTIAKVNNEFDIGSARSQFEEAKNALQNRNLHENALAELSENPAERIQGDMDKMLADDEINRRL